MARKQKFEGGTRNRIIEVGSRLFLEKGFDATGIRAIMECVGADVGVFYYYFDTKDKLFEVVLQSLTEPYCARFEQIVSDESQSPIDGLFRLFAAMEETAQSFCSKYGDSLHHSVRRALRDRVQTTLEPYAETLIVRIASDGTRMTMDPHTAAIFLSHAVGGCLLHGFVWETDERSDAQEREDADCRRIAEIEHCEAAHAEWLSVARPQILRAVKIVLGISE